jgi:hypothetical protein
VYAPIPGKPTVEVTQNRIVTVVRYGSDASGNYVEVRLAGSYGATMRLPLSCIRPLTDEERLFAP